MPLYAGRVTTLIPPTVTGPLRNYFLNKKVKKQKKPTNKRTKLLFIK